MPDELMMLMHWNLSFDFSVIGSLTRSLRLYFPPNKSDKLNVDLQQTGKAVSQVGIPWLSVMGFLWKYKLAARREKWVLKNGGILLEELIASSYGKSNPIRSFSAEQILKATTGFDKSFRRIGDEHFEWYTGIIKDQPVLVKKGGYKYKNNLRKEICHNIAVSSLMSSHKNVLKLLGCCLEFRFPVLVYEYAAKGPLNQRGGFGSDEILPWDIRLKIVKDIANVVTYIHTAFPEIIIHRDVKPTNIFLDENWNAKLGDFSLSVSIPPGKTFVESYFMENVGYFHPIYVKTGSVTEKTDLYSFGILMLVLLAGGGSGNVRDHAANLFENGEFLEIVDPRLLKDMGEDAEEKEPRIRDYLGLSLRCTGYGGVGAPKMIEVAKKLQQIQRSTTGNLRKSALCQCPYSPLV